jgi:hypothetical protein
MNNDISVIDSNNKIDLTIRIIEKRMEYTCNIPSRYTEIVNMAEDLVLTSNKFKSNEILKQILDLVTYVYNNIDISKFKKYNEIMLLLSFFLNANRITEVNESNITLTKGSQNNFTSIRSNKDYSKIVTISMYNSKLEFFDYNTKKEYLYDINENMQIESDVLSSFKESLNSIIKQFNTRGESIEQMMGENDYSKLINLINILKIKNI